MAEPKFSVVLIARNESKKLPHLIASLKEFQSRGGEVVLVDTGSKDGTPSVARELGCKVHEVGDKFRVSLNPTLACAINQEFIVNDEKPLVQDNDSFFDFAAARNFAAALAKNDMIAMPDCDEQYTAFDIDVLDSRIANGASHFEYDFVFSHDAQGRPDVQFTHCKFYDRTRLEWTGCVHEILRGRKGAAPQCHRLNANIVKLEHFQNPEQSRGQYLTGLAYDCFMNPDKDRNSHYLARELIWSDRPRSAIKEFERHIAMNGWAPERAQSAVFIGDAHAHFGEDDKMILAYQRAINIDATRREPLMKLAAHYFRKKDAHRVALYASAALSIDFHGYYMDRAHYYREGTHMMLYWACYYLNKKQEGLIHWQLARKFAPDNTQVLGDAQYYLTLPKVTIVIPTLDRVEQCNRLQELIKAHANYPNYEVLVMYDNKEFPRGVVQQVNEGVAKANSDLVMFLSDDCEPQPNFLIQAVLAYLAHPGLVALNDGLWNGHLATHWLASKEMLCRIPGQQFFHRDFKHHGCDNFLTAVCKNAGLYSYAPLARINHNHVTDSCATLAYKHDAEDKATLKRLLEINNLTDPV